MVFILQTSTGFIKRHINQIKPRSDHDDLSSSSKDDNTPFWWMPDTSNPPTTPPRPRHEEQQPSRPSQPLQSTQASNEVPAPIQLDEPQPSQPRRSGIPIRSSTRSRQDVNRFQPLDFKKRKTTNQM